MAAASFNNSDDNDDMLPNENDITIAEQESEEESKSSEEFNVAATLVLRMNLDETFDQHVHSSVTQKIAYDLEKRQTMQKPPRLLSKNKQATRCLSVYLRVRPLPTCNTKETTTTNTVEILEPSNQDVAATTVRTYPPVDSKAAKVVRGSGADGAVGGIKQFQFQQVFGPESTQQDLYTQVAAPMVHGLFPGGAPNNNKTSLVGESALLFAYGVSNSGKTHTIIGNVGKSHKKNMVTAPPTAEWGIVPRALHDMFAKMSSSPHKYNLHLSYLEIYNEKIYDLLLPEEKKNAPGSFSRLSATASPLRVREGLYGDTFVKGLVKRGVRDLNHGLELIELAQARRHTSSNNINADSSRSHCICQLQITAVTREHAAVVNDDNDSVASTASGYSTDEEALQISRQQNETVTMWIVDLAGSERSKRTGGARQKEAALINLSIMKLMRCLSIMGENQQHSSSARDVIPYRESKLTHLFMNHLSGKSASRTCMIVNINPASSDFDETQHVLSYAVAAKTVQISQEDYMEKRKAMNGNTNREATHGYDGRRLTPKRAVHKKKAVVLLGKDKKKAASTDTKKRKAELLNMRGTSVAVASDAHKAKMPRLGIKTKSAASPQSTANSSTMAVKNYEKALKSLQASLLIASRAEAEVLKSEKKAQQGGEISQIEEQVRKEVAEETEDQMRATMELCTYAIDRFELRSVRKARTDKAERVFEELIMDKVDECEDEVVRMREKHEKEMTQLQQDHKEEMQAKDEEILKAKSTFEEEIRAQKAEMAKLERRMESYQEEVEELRKFNQDLAETYDSTIIGDDEEQESVGEWTPANSSEEEPVSSPKNNSTSESNTKEVVLHSENTKNQEEVEELRKSNQDLAEMYDTIIGEDEEQESVGELMPTNSSEEELVSSPKNNSTSESNTKEVAFHSENSKNQEEVEELRKSNQDLAETTYDNIIGEDEEQESVGEWTPANSSEEEPVSSPKNNSTSVSNAEVVFHSEAMQLVTSVVYGDYNPTQEELHSGLEYRKGLNKLQLAFHRAFTEAKNMGNSSLYYKIKEWSKKNRDCINFDTLRRTPFIKNEELSDWEDYVSKANGIRKPAPPVELWPLVLVKQSRAWQGSKKQGWKSLPLREQVIADFTTKYYMSAGTFVTDDVYSNLKESLSNPPTAAELSFRIPSDENETQQQSLVSQRADSNAQGTLSQMVASLPAGTRFQPTIQLIQNQQVQNQQVQNQQVQNQVQGDQHQGDVHALHNPENLVSQDNCTMPEEQV